MSGDVSRRRNKQQPGGASKGPVNNVLFEDSKPNGSSTQSPRYIHEESSSSCCSCSKLIFYMLLSVFLLVATVSYVDYQTGQLNEAYVKFVPKEGRAQIAQMSKSVIKFSKQFGDNVKEGYSAGIRIARQYSSQIRIGDETLEDILFAKEVSDKESLEKQEEMARKMKIAIADLEKQKKEEEEKNKRAKAEEEKKAKEAAAAAAKKAEEKKKADEAAAAAANKKAQEDKKAKEVAAAAAKKAEEEKKAKEAATAAAAAAAKKAEEEKKAKEAAVAAAKKAEEEKKAKEAAVAAAKKAEEEKKAKEAAAAARKAEEEKKAKEAAAKRAEEEKKAAEAAMKAKEQKKKAEEAAKKAEEEKATIAAEAARKASELKAKEEAARKKANEELKAREAEAMKKAKAEAESKMLEEDRKAQETAAAAKKKAEEQAAVKKRLAQEEEARMKRAAAKDMDRDVGDKIAAKKAEQAQPKKSPPLNDEHRLKAAKKAAEAAKAASQKQDSKTADGGYAKSSITNAADQDIRDDLDEADSLIKSDPRLALAKFESILESRDQSPRALYGKARALDQISVKERSNQYLEQSIQTFLAVLDLGQDVPDDLYRMSGVRVVERMQFRGWSRKAVHVLQEMLNRFPGDVELGNELGVQYLMTGKNIDARKVFSRTVEADPTNGFAAVHLGFILKTGGFEHDQERAASLLKQGIESGEKGTQDGKFYYHLGEVLQRMGKKEESDRVYKEGVEKGFFLSFWQRSLYNVGHLKAQPIWTKQESGERLGLTTLEKNWKVIRSEALSILEEEKFKAEAENLKDTGTWGQFELYRRGEKIPSNCARAPVTCALIDLVPAAKGCKRGQVKFSLMSEGTHVHPHAGPTNCRLRAHLGLVVPEHTGEIRLRVADEYLSWKEGNIFIFDDSFEHEVWHEGQGNRIVLIIDLWHPGLSEKERNELSPI